MNNDHLQHLEKMMQLSPGHLQVEIGRLARISALGATDTGSEPDDERGKNWIERNRENICRELWANTKVASFMRGEEQFTQIVVATTVMDIIAMYCSIPLAAAGSAFIVKTGLYNYCRRYQPEQST